MPNFMLAEDSAPNKLPPKKVQYGPTGYQIRDPRSVGGTFAAGAAQHVPKATALGEELLLLGLRLGAQAMRPKP